MQFNTVIFQNKTERQRRELSLLEVTKPVFVSVLSKQIKLNDYNRCFWMWCSFPEFIASFSFGIFSAWDNTNTIHSAQEMSLGLENALKL